jgi:hypothetical protein
MLAGVRWQTQKERYHQEDKRVGEFTEIGSDVVDWIDLSQDTDGRGLLRSRQLTFRLHKIL